MTFFSMNWIAWCGLNASNVGVIAGLAGSQRCMYIMSDATLSCITLRSPVAHVMTIDNYYFFNLIIDSIDHHQSSHIMSEHVPPPTYSQQDPVDATNSQTSQPVSDPQILIIPTANAVNFQK